MQLWKAQIKLYYMHLKIFTPISLKAFSQQHTHLVRPFMKLPIDTEKSIELHLTVPRTF